MSSNQRDQDSLFFKVFLPVSNFIITIGDSLPYLASRIFTNKTPLSLTISSILNTGTLTLWKSMYCFSEGDIHHCLTCREKLHVKLEKPKPVMAVVYVQISRSFCSSWHFQVVRRLFA
jgi:hypothetical protein